MRIHYLSPPTSRMTVFLGGWLCAGGSCRRLCAGGSCSSCLGQWAGGAFSCSLMIGLQEVQGARRCRGQEVQKARRCRRPGGSRPLPWQVLCSTEARSRSTFSPGQESGHQSPLLPLSLLSPCRGGQHWALARPLPYRLNT